MGDKCSEAKGKQIGALKLCHFCVQQKWTPHLSPIA
jgi:hypothetical protein